MFTDARGLTLTTDSGVARAYGLLDLRIFFPMVSFSLLGLQHPEPTGSRSATPILNVSTSDGTSPMRR